MSLLNKRCLVTGANGFVGSYLVERLRGEGANVIALTHEKADTTRLEDILPYFYGIEYVFNTVALANLQACLDNPVLCYKTTIMSAVNVLEASRLCRAKRVVLSSSNIVGYQSNPYKMAVEAVERIGQDYVTTYNQSVISLRYANIYGRRPPTKYRTTTLIDAFVKSRQQSGYIKVMGSGEQTRDYIHIHDVVDANLAAALSDHCSVMDICTGKQTSVLEVARFFDCPIQHTPPRPNNAETIDQNPYPAKHILGWEAKIPLAEGIIDVLDTTYQIL